MMNDFVELEKPDIEETQRIWKRYLEKIETLRKRGKNLNNNVLGKIFSKAMKTAKNINHRRIFMLSGDDYRKSISYLSKMLKIFVKDLADKPVLDILFACSNFSNDVEATHLDLLRKNLDSLTKYSKIDLTTVEFKNSKTVMGRTFDTVIIDFFKDLHPNDIGRVIETVKGGGAVFMLLPKIEKFAELKTNFYEYITTIPWSVNDVPGRLMKFILKKFLEGQGIYILDVDNDKVLKEPKEPKNVKTQKLKKLSVPEKKILPDKVYKLAITQDQISSLYTLERILKRWMRKEAVVITADRGRGKSASIGIFIGALAKMKAGQGHLGRFLVLVTAPEEYNVYTLFEFAAKTLQMLGEDIKVYKSPPEIRGKGFVIAYYPPYDSTKIAKRDKPEVIVVDEAAGLPIPILFKLLDLSNKTIYSSTIHGYEGAGRGFSIRFIEALKKRTDVVTHFISMSEPIRYSKGDPIESFVFEALLLKAEPPKLSDEDYEDINNMNVFIERADLDKWFLLDSKDLRSFIGIYVFAHYRNEPKDLGILADAPHYEAYALKTSTNKIVTSVLVAKEGMLPDSLIREIYINKQAEPSGHLIPVAVEKHYRSMEFPKLRGVRVVRIATHPRAMRRGLGSKALRLIEGVFRERGYDWIGSSFGANPQLIRFWLKNRYVPIHISPKRHKVSGEYTVVVLKPLKKTLEGVIRRYYREFRIRFLEWLRYVHYDIEPELARELLVGGHIWGETESRFTLSPRLTKIQEGRLEAFLNEVISYELACDAVNELVKNYFIDENPDKPELNELEELLLISRVLQARTLKQTIDVLNINKVEAKEIFKEIIQKLYNHYVKFTK